MDIIREQITAQGHRGLFPAAYFGGLRWAVLDIETLGLSPGRAPAILCGLVTPGSTADIAGGTAAASSIPLSEAQNAPETAEAVQFFAESIAGTTDEESMLTALEEALDDIDIVVTYNGRQFDLPYLAARRKKIRMPAMRPRYNLDLLPIVRYCTDIGKFVPNLKQKTLEDFCGIWDGRTDEISGRESISLYYDYLSERDPALKEKILLHNRDDIVQLYRLTDVLRRADMHKAAFRYGFPVRAPRTAAQTANTISCRQQSPLLLVSKLELANGRLTAEGIISGPAFDEIRYGDEKPSWRFLDGSFLVEVPVIRHEGLLLADMDGVDADIDPAILASGYVILQQDREVQYEHCTLLIKGILERILEQWEM